MQDQEPSGLESDFICPYDSITGMSTLTLEWTFDEENVCEFIIE